ncbi:MAG TPA: hypothetical protein PK613_13535 [Anaerolineaceae bacterium]|nr:hypothetical protein [Anaerolineaceae bacterium]
MKGSHQEVAGLPEKAVEVYLAAALKEAADRAAQGKAVVALQAEEVEAHLVQAEGVYFQVQPLTSEVAELLLGGVEEQERFLALRREE